VSLRNLLWTNHNPNPDRICGLCKPMIGTVWEPGTEPPLPLHPFCYCAYFPTDQPATDAPPPPEPGSATWRAWVRYVASLLRYRGPELPPWLELFRADAERYNLEHQGDDSMPGTDPTPSPDALTLASGRLFLAAVDRSARREYRCSFMTAGRVKQVDQQPSSWLLPPEVLAASAHLFEARPSYLDHPDLFGFGWHQEPKVARLIGVTFDPQWDPEEQAIVGGLRLYDRDPASPGHLVGALLDQIFEDQLAGKPVPPIGLSAVFFHTSRLDEDTGLRVTDALHYVESIDLVYDPGAAGYIRQALAALRPSPPLSPPLPVRWERGPGGEGLTPTGGTPMSAELTPETIAPEDVRAQHAAPLPDPPAVDLLARLNALQQHVDRLTQALAAAQEPRVIQGVQPAARGMQSGLDRVELALDALLNGTRPAGDVAPLAGIRELYTLLSGDFEMTGRFNADRVYLANVNSSTMAGLVANALNKRVVNQFQSYPQWWASAVTIEDFTSLQQIRWITLGGIGDLPTVAEGAAYSELTWDDQTETAAFVKKGGYLGLTIEAIDKDDTRRLQAAPRALAQAAWLTLGKSIAAIFTDNSGTGPTMADTYQLFDSSNHGNLGTSAFSHTAWQATKLAMMKYTELNSGERLAALTKPYLLWVPIDLEADAIAELAAGEGLIGSADYNINADAFGDALTTRLAAARARVIACPFWTDTDNWAAQADPRLYPGIGLGFRYGRTPEIFSVASPTAGLMFTNDTMPVKVRWFYAVGPTDYRAFYKHNVG